MKQTGTAAGGARGAGKRSYHDACGAAKALDLVGERWALLVVRELLFGPKRFTDLRGGLPAISPNVLSQRLNELEEIDVVRRHKLPPPASAWVYELTEWGRKLDVVLMELGRWAAQAPTFEVGGSFSVDSLLMSFRTMFAPERAHDFTGTFEFRYGEQRHGIEIDSGRLRIVPGEVENPDATIEAEPIEFAGIVYEQRPLDGLTITGDRAKVEQFVGFFELPTPIAV